MTEWRPIESLPEDFRDGRLVSVKRVHEGRVVKEGQARWASRHRDAPSRSPLNDPAPWRASLSETQAERDAYSDRMAWVLPDRMYLFPEPTHWRPE